MLSMRHLLVVMLGCVILMAERPAIGQTSAAKTIPPAAAVNPANSPKYWASVFAKTQDARSADDFGDVIEICERALATKLAPEHAKYAKELAAWAYNRRGEVYAEQAAAVSDQGYERKANELDALALADFEASIAADPAKWKALHNRGVSRALHGQAQEALADFNEVLKLNPEFVDVYFNRGEVYLNQGKLLEAIADYSKLMQQRTGDVGALLHRGHAYRLLKKYEEALADYNQVLRFKPDSAAALAQRGGVYTALGRWEAAAEDFRQALKLNPQLGLAYRGAAWLMATCPEPAYRNVELALESAKKALEIIGAADFQCLDTLAAAQASAGKFADAKTTLEKAIQTAPEGAIAELAARLELYAAEKPFRAKAVDAGAVEAGAVK